MKPVRWLLLAFALFICSAHVGSPDVWFQGEAGPYAVRVRVQPPQVIPGLAQVSVRVYGGARHVTVAPARSDTGDEGQPPPDVGVQDAQDPEVFNTTIWLMARGAYRIVVDVNGERGRGRAIVPVVATATTRLPMSRPLTWVLLGAALFLFAGMVTIVGAAVRESVLPPGEQPAPQRLRRARLAMVGGTLVVAFVLFVGWRWWSEVDSYHKAGLDRPWSVETTVSNGTLRFAITDSIWLLRNRPRSAAAGQRPRNDALLPDHGKIMHMFLIRSDQAAFAHVHPTTRDENVFTVPLPELPAGKYHVYADVVHESGYAWTMPSTVEIAEPVKARSTDSDDASWIAPANTGDVVFKWAIPERVPAGKELNIAVEVVNARGEPVALEPYMGMPGHAVVQRDSGDVYVHLHSNGTISAAAQQAVAQRADQVTTMPHTTTRGNSVSFPYAFPRPGKYRVWVQARFDGRVVTAATDVVVT